MADVAVPHGTTFELLLAAIRIVYARDKLAPGVVVSEVEPGSYYASIARYPSHRPRAVVAKVRGGDGACLPSVLRALCERWLKEEVPFAFRFKPEVAALQERISEPMEVEGH